MLCNYGLLFRKKIVFLSKLFHKCIFVLGILQIRLKHVYAMLCDYSRDVFQPRLSIYLNSFNVCGWRWHLWIRQRNSSSTRYFGFNSGKWECQYITLIFCYTKRLQIELQCGKKRYQVETLVHWHYGVTLILAI